jgi:hypothetical protein
VQKSHKDNIHVILSGVRPEVMRVIKNTSFYEEVGEENIFDNILSALARAREIINDPHIHHRKHQNKAQ